MCTLLCVHILVFAKCEWVSEVPQACPTLCDPMDCSPPGSSVHGIFEARILERVAISFSRRASWPRDWTQVSPTVGRCFTVWATREVLAKYNLHNKFYSYLPLPNAYGMPKQEYIKTLTVFFPCDFCRFEC